MSRSTCWGFPGRSDGVVVAVLPKSTPRERRPTAPDRFVGCRSILFVPADRPDRCANALTSGADAVCIDLEDAVAPGRKDAGRAGLRGLLAGWRAGAGGGDCDGDVDRGDDRERRRPLRVVRINDPASAEGRLDAELLASDGEPGIDAVMIPKVRAAHGLQETGAMLSDGVALLPMIETASGLEHAAEIASARLRPVGGSGIGGLGVGSGPGVVPATVTGIVFGGFDLSLELGAEPGWESLLYARSRVVHAAALAGVPAFDMPSREIRGDLAALRREAVRARRLGFCGKTAIHPAQLPVIHDVFAPSDEAVACARRLLEADRKAAGGPVALDGKMVDRPVVEAARRVLARAGEADEASGNASVERDPAPS